MFIVPRLCARGVWPFDHLSEQISQIWQECQGKLLPDMVKAKLHEKGENPRSLDSYFQQDADSPFLATSVYRLMRRHTSSCEAV